MNEEITIIAEQCAKLEKKLSESRPFERWSVAQDGKPGDGRVIVNSTGRAIGDFMALEDAQAFVAAHNGE